MLVASRALASFVWLKKIRTTSPQITSKSFEMLTMAIDKPTDAAAVQITARRRLIVGFFKVMAD